MQSLLRNFIILFLGPNNICTCIRILLSCLGWSQPDKTDMLNCLFRSFGSGLCKCCTRNELEGTNRQSDLPFWAGCHRKFRATDEWERVVCTRVTCIRSCRWMRLNYEVKIIWWHSSGEGDWGVGVWSESVCSLP